MDKKEKATEAAPNMTICGQRSQKRTKEQNCRIIFLLGGRIYG